MYFFSMDHPLFASAKTLPKKGVQSQHRVKLHHLWQHLPTQGGLIQDSEIGVENLSNRYVDVWEPGIIVENRQKQLLLHTSLSSIICQTR